MTQKIRLAALGIAIVVNGSALAALQFAMLERFDRERLLLHDPARGVAAGSEHALPEHGVLAKQNCAAPKAL